MTFIEWLDNNWVKVLGTITSLNGTLIALIAGGAFEGLIEPPTIKWLGIGGAFVGAFVTSRGMNNTSKEKIASAMEAAINATPVEKVEAKIEAAVNAARKDER